MSPKSLSVTMESGQTNARSNKKRKRQEKLQQYGIDLPEIPGVPVQVVPLLVHGLKTSTKFFQYETSSAYNDDWKHQREGRGGEEEPLGSQSQGALDNVLNRIDSTTQNSAKQEQQQERKIKMNDAIQAWLQGVKRFVNKKEPHQKNSEISDPSSNLPDRDGLVRPNEDKSPRFSQSKKSVPLSCFVYIWGLGQEHKRLAVRRAALNLNRHLLDKSSDCRRFFLQESSHLWQWIQMLSSDEEGPNHKMQRLWQKEGHYLLLHLLRQNYDELYPKLRVAEQFLRQACSLEVGETLQDDGDEYGGTTNMVVLRQLRDIAMMHGAEEIRRVRKLISRAHKCMDILVPRLGETVSAPEKAAETKGEHDFYGSDVEDDDIDWEEGWEENGNEPEDSGGSATSLTHAQAVERTLQAMESIGGLRSGALEINLSGANDDSVLAGKLSSSSDTQVLLAKERFTKCAEFLAQRHLPRIRAWLEGLEKADRLYSPSPQSSLILIPAEKSIQRSKLHEQLTDLKQQVMSILQSAGKLALQAGIED